MVLFIFIFVIVFLLFLYYFCDCNILLLLAERFGKPPSSLNGKIVWVTGASSGIGEHLAYSLARHGCKLILSARREDELNRVKSKCLMSGPLQETDILIAPLDISDINSHEAVLKKALEHFKKIDILVNNAGIVAVGKSLSMSVATDQKIFNTNTLGTIALTKTVLPLMIENSTGHIVTVTSVTGLMAANICSGYVGSKFALHGYFDSLRLELNKQNIYITLVCPGPVESDIFKTELNANINQVHLQNRSFETSFNSMVMSAERCGDLIAIAIANKLKEVWICRQRMIVIMYLTLAIPDFFKRFQHLISNLTLSEN